MRVDVLDLLSYYNIEGIIRGSEFAFRCPFHNDRDPSANFNIHNSLWTCFRCKIGGNSIDFVSLIESWEYKQAELWLRNRYGGFYKPASLFKEISKYTETQFDKIYSDSVLNQYQVDHPYWRTRGIGPKIRKKFELGYDSSSARVTIPIRDHTGKLVGVQGRTILKSVDEDKYKFIQPFSKKQHIFGLHLMDTTDEVVVVEGLIAAIRLYSLGIPCVSTMGSVVSIKQAQFLSSFKKVFMLFDDDDAGTYGMFGPLNKPKSNIAAWKRINSKVYIPTISYEDIDNLTKEEIQNILFTSKIAEIWVPILKSKKLCFV